ncbi:hypothetical protein CAC42_1781 [Sphaceloma murrayae]|uniref:Methyltransferase domain-containing protein n=1 Tax=Sphaceloma murrayae TaxID=2082308 RepID=A0A2K1QVG3_9PEZI|nr:hypothetical protein CAC42_1781 [Sphaceloma murrayae]
MSNPPSIGNPFWDRVYRLQTPEECQALYDDWATSYNNDLLDKSQDYVAPTLAVQSLLAAQGNIHGAILDAGCGTGLVGIALRQAGAEHIDGLDFSAGMLDVARKTGVYESLETGDLMKPLRMQDSVYDAVTCVGTLTKAHVGPVPALREFVRVAKKGGLVVVTVLELIWESGGYKAEVERLQTDGNVEIVGIDSMDYRKAKELKGKMVVMRKR